LNECIFGEIINGNIRLNKFGKIVETEWLLSKKIRSEIDLDVCRVMPNHFHGIVLIFNLPSNRNRNIDLDVTSKINKLRGTPGNPVLQRNYFDRIIRNEQELSNIRKFIINNPLKWELDLENPVCWKNEQ